MDPNKRPRNPAPMLEAEEDSLLVVVNWDISETDPSPLGTRRFCFFKCRSKRKALRVDGEDSPSLLVYADVMELEVIEETSPDVEGDSGLERSL